MGRLFFAACPLKIGVLHYRINIPKQTGWEILVGVDRLSFFLDKISWGRSLFTNMQLLAI